MARSVFRLLRDVLADASKLKYRMSNTVSSSGSIVVSGGSSTPGEQGEPTSTAVWPHAHEDNLSGGILTGYVVSGNAVTIQYYIPFFFDVNGISN